jgi:hypothetical protein
MTEVITVICDDVITPEQIARAFAIADEAMFERLRTEGVPLDEHWTAFGLTDEGYMEEPALAEASEGMRETFEWLRDRGYVELGTDKDGEFINVLRRPGEETDA